MKIELFVTCLVDTLFPEVGEAVVELLEQCGVEVLFNESQTCCGQPPFNAGFTGEAKTIAEHMLDTYENSDEMLVIPSGSCTAMIRQSYSELFQDDAHNLERAKKLSERAIEFSEFMVDILSKTQFPDAANYPVAYHPSCHQLRELKTGDRPQILLAENFPGYQTLEEECCGFGGVFSIDQPELSAEMLKRKIANIQANSPEAVIACDVSCLMQIEGGLRKAGSPIRCAHLAQALAGKPAGLR
jgi:L-lactate dehydrogenase complex protein LldE